VVASTLWQAYGYLPSRRLIPTFDIFIIPGDRGTCVWTTCLRFLPESKNWHDAYIKTASSWKRIKRPIKLKRPVPLIHHHLHHAVIITASAPTVLFSSYSKGRTPSLPSPLPPFRTQTHPFYGPFSGTTRVSRYQKCTTNLDFTEARDIEWQCHQLGHMQVCTSLRTDNHASTPPLSFLQAGCPSCRPTNSVKALKAIPFRSRSPKYS